MVGLTIRVGPKGCERRSFCVTRLGLQKCQLPWQPSPVLPSLEWDPLGLGGNPLGKSVLLPGEVCFTESQPLGDLQAKGTGVVAGE